MTKRFDLVRWLVFVLIYTAASAIQWHFLKYYHGKEKEKEENEKRKQKQWKQFHQICISHSMHHFWYGQYYIWCSLIHSRASSSSSSPASSSYFTNKLNNIPISFVYTNTLLIIICITWSVFLLFLQRKTNAFRLFTFFSTRAKIKFQCIVCVF